MAAKADSDANQALSNDNQALEIQLRKRIRSAARAHAQKALASALAAHREAQQAGLVNAKGEQLCDYVFLDVGSNMGQVMCAKHGLFAACLIPRICRTSAVARGICRPQSGLREAKGRLARGLARDAG